MEKLKIGVIGTGKMGSYHARVLSRLPQVELVRVCDAHAWKAHLAAWRFNTRSCTDTRELLNQVQAVVIAVPTSLHAQVGLQALRQGVHCLIEKPLALRLSQAKELLQEAQERNLVLQVGHIERFNPAVLEAVRYIKSPRYINVERLGPYDPRVSDIGVVLDLMIHDLDILLALVQSEVVSLEALGASLLSPHEDIANVRLRFQNGCVADLTASRISLAQSRKIRIYQAQSYLSLDYAHASLKVCRRKGAVVRSLSDVEMVYPKLPKKESLQSELEHFIECVRSGKKPWTSGESGMEAMKLAFRITDELEKHELHHPAASSVEPALKTTVSGGETGPTQESDEHVH